jgi:dihydroorotate dehydrogenase electron transfer subunit
MWLEAPYIASQAQPGQFVMVRCGEDTLLRRPFSVHQADGKRIALLFNVVGRGTQWLSQQQADDSLDLLGLLGNGFSIHPDSKNLLLVAGGIGVAPLVFLAQKASKAGCSVTLLLGAQTKSQLYPQNLLPPEVKLITATEDGTAGKRGLVTDLLPDFTAWADQVFACGPLPMYQAMVQMPQLRHKPAQISLEVRMGCGLGVCYGCTVKTKSGLKQVCKDGPVFELEEVEYGSY